LKELVLTRWRNAFPDYRMKFMQLDSEFRSHRAFYSKAFELWKNTKRSSDGDMFKSCV